MMWVKIEGWPYEINPLGEVRRVGVQRTSKPVAPYTGSNGYMMIRLFNCRSRKDFRLHRLIAEAFLPNPGDFPFINHKDENKLNYELSNLEWCNNQYNAEHSVKEGFEITDPQGQTHRVKGLRRFCREHGIDNGSMRYAIKVGSTHKGFTGRRI